MVRTDRELVEACLNGHPEEYRQLVCRYQAALLSFLCGRLQNKDWAEEALQETFVRAYFSMNRLRKPDSFFSWLLGIAGNVAKERERKARRQPAFDIEALEKPQAPGKTNDLSLERAIASLPEACREAVLLRYYRGLSCAEAAQEQNVSLGTLTKRLSRAYAMLREQLSRTESY